jgi:leucyl aminopeptidase
MQILVERKPIGEIRVEALILAIFEGEKGFSLDAAELIDSGEVTCRPLELTLIHNPKGMATIRVLLAGAGRSEQFEPAQLSKLIGAAVRYLKSRSVKTIAFEMIAGRDGRDWASAAVEGAVLGSFEPDRYKTSGDKKSVESFALVAVEGMNEIEEGATRGRILAEAQNFARAMVNEPSNIKTPRAVAEAAVRMAAKYGLESEIFGREEMVQLGMGALLGVAQGSAEPPTFVIVRYSPSFEHSQVHLGLVGKGVTFDAGGISIKPAYGMQKMKNDMAGGAAVLGAMRAIAQLKPEIRVTAFIPCVENMPSGCAQRPGDIVTTMSGKTVEVVNTDAEGRLILADALAYARKQGCTHIVDVATLTDAITVALGHQRMGLFTNHDELRERVLRASEAEGERMWHMPLDEDYKEYLSSSFADLANVGPRFGGAVSAACFLKEFAAETPWVHLDIAGSAWLDDGRPHLCKGATGLPVKTLVRLAADWTD